MVRDAGAGQRVLPRSIRAGLAGRDASASQCPRTRISILTIVL